MRRSGAAIVLMATLCCVSAASAAGAPGGPAYCQMYASTTSGTVADALKRKSSCLDYSKGVHADYKMHYDWCMRTPTAEVESAANHIRDLANRCLAAGGNARAPVPGKGVVSLYARSNGNLCLGAVTGMLNVGLVTNCMKPPARIRIDAGGRRIRAGDSSTLCLSFAVGKFSEFNDLLVAPCNRVIVDLIYDPATTQIRTKGDYCLGVDGAVREGARLKMQSCSPNEPGQKWLLDSAVARPLR
jgi:hypothetical protein